MRHGLLLMAVLTLGCFQVKAQNTPGYSRVKINADAAGLAALANLGVAVDHGFSKEDSYFISDFSDQEIQIMQENHFNFEILIPDVVTHYSNFWQIRAKILRCTTADVVVTVQGAIILTLIQPPPPILTWEPWEAI
jgi:hypothetical protein